MNSFVIGGIILNLVLLSNSSFTLVFLLVKKHEAVTCLAFEMSQVLCMNPNNAHNHVIITMLTDHS